MITSGIRCSVDRDKARKQATNPSYIITLVTLYHDTFPRNPLRALAEPAGWPRPPTGLDEMFAAGLRVGRYARGDLRTAPALCQGRHRSTRLSVVPTMSATRGARDDRDLRQVCDPRVSTRTSASHHKYRAAAKPKYQMLEKRAAAATTMWTERARG